MSTREIRYRYLAISPLVFLILAVLRLTPVPVQERGCRGCGAVPVEGPADQEEGGPAPGQEGAAGWQARRERLGGPGDPAS